MKRVGLLNVLQYIVDNLMCAFIEVNFAIGPKFETVFNISNCLLYNIWITVQNRPLRFII